MMQLKDIQIRDPFILPDKKSGTYYLYGTTDKNAWTGKAVGFDAYRSKDLRSFEGPFTVFRSDKDFWADENFWAPEVHRYNGKYYMIASFKAARVCRGSQILSSDTPLGPFVPITDRAITPKEWECLDGTLYIDHESQPWIVFCHEWQQVKVGRVCAMKLCEDLKNTLSNPIVLFEATDAVWSINDTGPIPSDGTCYVTDGPYLFRESDELLMLWSSYGAEGYAIGIARSDNGKITGNWIHNKEPFFKKDGGHGMVFNRFNGQRMLVIHAPNETPRERAKLIPLSDYLI